MSMSEAVHSDHSHADRLWSLIKDVRYPVITTHRSDGGLQSRPMSMQNRDTDPLDFLWLFAPRDSDQVEDLQWDSSVSIVFADSSAGVYVVVFGSASVVEDAGRKRQLWSPEAQSWFPGGPDDPTMALVRVRIIQADCWDVKRNAVNHLFKLDTSAMTYRPPGQASGATRH
jgi:general stress protein 26